MARSKTRGRGFHPFGDTIGLKIGEVRPGFARTEVRVARGLLNPHGVAHGAVAYALADTGMGAALYSVLAPGESCSTIEIKINYVRPASEGSTLICSTTLAHRGRTTALLESIVTCDGKLIAKAQGTYAIHPSREKEPFSPKPHPARLSRQAAGRGEASKGRRGGGSQPPR